jgi:hypothetical protein
MLDLFFGSFSTHSCICNLLVQSSLLAHYTDSRALQASNQCCFDPKLVGPSSRLKIRHQACTLLSTLQAAASALLRDASQRLNDKDQNHPKLSACGTCSINSCKMRGPRMEDACNQGTRSRAAPQPSVPTPSQCATRGVSHVTLNAGGIVSNMLQSCGAVGAVEAAAEQLDQLRRAALQQALAARQQRLASIGRDGHGAGKAAISS